MKISLEDIVLAAEAIELREDNYRVRESYRGRNGSTGAGVDLLDSEKVTEFLISLAVVLAEDDRAEDARELARKTRTDSMGFGVAIYWSGVELIA